MKKLLVLMLTSILLFSCDTEETRDRLKDECRSLRIEASQLKSETNRLYNNVNTLNSEIKELRAERNALKSGRDPKYIVKFEIKQGTFTLDIGEHIKNSMNAIEIEIPVNRDFYNTLSKGQDLTDSFKWGSLVFNGDFSNLHMRVIGKRIE